jgi:hypothetical protein
MVKFNYNDTSGHTGLGFQTMIKEIDLILTIRYQTMM